MLYDPKWEKPAETAPNGVRDVLVAARKRIERRENWLNRAPGSHEEKAGKFCAARAIWSLSETGVFAHEAYGLLCKVTGARCLPEFNDSHTHAEVLAAFDRAIAAA